MTARNALTHSGTMTMPTEPQSGGWKVVPVKTKDASGRKTMYEELKPCPFCGWAGAKTHKKFKGYRWMESLVAEIRVDKMSYYVSCNRCKARGGVVTGRVVTHKRSFKSFDPIGNQPESIPVPDWATTTDELEQKAVESWNRRADDGKNKAIPNV